MARKRLSDLLREEAQKSPKADEGAAATNKGAEGTKAAASATPKTEGRSPASAPAPKVSAVEVTETEAAADLQSTVDELKSLLSTVHQTEQTLQEKIATLESDLKEQQKLVEQLKADLDQASRDRAELEEAKQLILKLSDENIKTAQELEALKQNKGRQNGNLVAQPQAQTHSTNWELRQILSHPVQAGMPSTAFSDGDLGWVD